MYDGYDEFTQVRNQEVVLGEVQSSHFGDCSKVIVSVGKHVYNGKEGGETAYSVRFVTAQTASLAGSFLVNNQGMVIFIIGDDRYTFQTKDLKKNRSFGLFGYLCACDFRIGPLPEPVLDAMRDGQEIRYKIFGEFADTEGVITSSELEEAKKILETPPNRVSSRSFYT